MTPMRQRAAQGLGPGDRFTVTRRFTNEDVRSFAALTRDYNPVHFDAGFAAAHGFEGTICHGLLVAGLLTEMGGQIAWLASGMSFRFLGPVFPGDAITCDLVIVDVEEDGRARGQALMTNQRGEEVLRAELYGRVPGPREQAILQTMLAQGDPTNPLWGASLAVGRSEG